MLKEEEEEEGSIMALEKIPEKSGEGFPGLDLNSGWNWTPIKKGWLGSSTICTHAHNYQIILNIVWRY